FSSERLVRPALNDRSAPNERPAYNPTTFCFLAGERVAMHLPRRGDTMPTTPTEVAQLWRRVNREVRELIRSTAKRDDLPPLTFPVLFHIQKEPGITVSELARKIG